MERTRGLKKGLKGVATAMFLAAALMSTGCGENALMNPVSNDAAQGQQISNSDAGREPNPAGRQSNP